MPLPPLRAANAAHAEPLPDPFKGLRNSKYGVRFYPGQLVMIAGPPGGGKTTLSLAAVLRMGVSCLYFSADSNEMTMLCRAASALTGHSVSAVYGAWEFGMFRELYGHVLKGSPIRFEFEPTDPSITDITNALEAYHEVEGAYPRLLVIDTITNTESGEANEWGGYRKTAKDLHWLARRTKACVLVLCHTSEQNMDHVLAAPPRSAIQGKISQLPSVIITMATNDAEMFLGVVKNRFGPSDPAAKHPVKFIADLSRVRIDDLRMDGGQLGA
jgi:RecA-superfamily ATPases implicated in signal transduction